MKNRRAKHSIIIRLLLVVFSFTPLHSFSSELSKYRQECALTSSEFKNKLPSDFTSVWCADDKRRDFGEMGPDVVHAMAVAAFYEKRMDRRMAAITLLERYDCSEKDQCKEFHHLLDWGIKSGHPARYNRDLANRAHLLREKISKKLETL